MPVSQLGFELGLWRFDSFPPSQNAEMPGIDFRHSRREWCLRMAGRWDVIVMVYFPLRCWC